MALKSTIFKAQLNIADIDHDYYEDHLLTLAKHPSETEERLMVRLIAWALQAHQVRSLCQGDGTLAFGSGMSNPDLADIELRDFAGRVRLWMEVGQPDEKPLIKACGQADQVVVYCFSHAASIWWRGIQNKLTRCRNLEVWNLPQAAMAELPALVQRNMALQVTVLEGVLSLSDGTQSWSVEPQRW